MALRPKRTWGCNKENAQQQLQLQLGKEASARAKELEVFSPTVPERNDRLAAAQALDRSAETFRQVNPSEMRRRLVDTRAAFRTLQMAHKKLHHKIKVDRVISDAIERNENSFLKKQVLELKEQKEAKDQELASKDKLIQNLKRRIAAQSRSRSTGRNMSQVGSMMDFSTLDMSMDIRDTSPPPGPRHFAIGVEAATQITPCVGQATSPLAGRGGDLTTKVDSFDQRMAEVERNLEEARRVQREQRDSQEREESQPQRQWTVDVSPMSTVSAEGGMSVEGGLDQVNQRILCMLSTGATALNHVSPEAPDLDETTLDEESLLRVSRLDDRSEAVPHGWLIEQLQMVRDDFKEQERAASEYCQLDSARSTSMDRHHQAEIAALREQHDQVARERDQMAQMAQMLVHNEAERRNAYSEPRSSRTLLASCSAPTCTPRDDLSRGPTPRVLPPSHPSSGSNTPSGPYSAMIARATSSGALLSPPMPYGQQRPGHGSHGHGNHGHGQQPRGYIKVGEHKTEHWRIVY